MGRLFSIFDPRTSFSFLTNFLVMLISLFFLSSRVYIKYRTLECVKSGVGRFLCLDFKSTLGEVSRHFTMLGVEVFFFIALLNSVGIIPCVFTASSHGSFSLGFAVSLWLISILYRLVNDVVGLVSHLVPLGTPWYIMSFIVLVERVSIIIRPLTLSIRLSANMVAGHLLMCLFGERGVWLSSSGLVRLDLVQRVLVVLERRIALIQGYVFSALVVLYTSEV